MFLVCLEAIFFLPSSLLSFIPILFFSLVSLFLYKRKKKEKKLKKNVQKKDRKVDWKSRADWDVGEVEDLSLGFS